MLFEGFIDFALFEGFIDWNFISCHPNIRQGNTIYDSRIALGRGKLRTLTNNLGLEFGQFVLTHMNYLLFGVLGTTSKSINTIYSSVRFQTIESSVDAFFVRNKMWWLVLAPYQLLS